MIGQVDVLDRYFFYRGVYADTVSRATGLGVTSILAGGPTARRVLYVCRRVDIGGQSSAVLAGGSWTEVSMGPRGGLRGRGGGIGVVHWPIRESGPL